MKSFFVFLFICVSLFGDVGIEEIWRGLEKSNDGLKAAQDAQKIAKLKQSSAKSMYLPSISIVGSYTHLSDPIGTDTHSVASSLSDTMPLTSAVMSALPNKDMDFTKQDIFLADLHMLWPLYTGGKIDAAQDIYKAALDESKAVLQMKKDKEFLKLVKYYYGSVVALSLYKTTLHSQKALQIHYENAKKLKQQGQIANIELLNAKVKLDSANIQTIQAKHKYEISSTALFALIKRDIKPVENIYVYDVLKQQHYYQNEMKKHYAPLGILDAKNKQTEALLKIKKADYYPSVVGYANYNLYKDDSPLMETMPQWFAGIMVKIDILKRKDRSEDIESVKLLNAKVRHTKAQAVEDLAILVEKTYKEMCAYKEEYDLLKSSIKLAKENYRLREIAFKEGLSTSVEVVDAQMFLFGAKTKRLNAAYNYIQKLAQLCVLSGDRDMFFEIVGR